MSDPNVIQARKPFAIQILTEPVRIPYRGPIESDRFNKFTESVLGDLATLAQQGNSTAQSLLNYVHTLQTENDGARTGALAAQRQIDFQNKVLGLQGRQVGFWYDLHDGSRVSFLPGSEISKRASVSTQYGEATIPMNAAQAKTYSLAIVGGGGVSALNAIVSATGTFDQGDGVMDYEMGGTVEETDPANIANGNNDEYWRRRVVFDLDSDVSEVEVELTLTLPDQSSIQANVLYTHPYPLAGVDITGLWLASDLSGSFSLVQSTAIESATKKRWLLPAQDVAQVKIRLRQRNWREENGKKVFEYGLQELGVLLVEWDKSYDAAASQLKDNHSFVTRFVPPAGMLFNKLYGFYSEPNFLLETVGNRHLHFVLAKDENGTQVVWNSDSTAAPQALTSPLDCGGVEELYLIITLNWAVSVSGGSPFTAGCPPFVRGFGLNVSLLESA